MNPELNQKYEEGAWKIVTQAITTCIEFGEIDEAKRQAQLAIEDWKQEGKTQRIQEFREWLESKEIKLDSEVAE